MFSYVVIWNVGQGQWITSVENCTCRHFDVGGEKFPWKKVGKLCRDKDNLIYLSHWDWDHIGALSRWPKSWQSCLALRPQGVSSAKKMKMLAEFKDCKTDINLPMWRGLKENNALNLRNTQKNLGKSDSNALSQVLRFGEFLFPGDSPIASEKSWMELPWIAGVRVLILGHHGSRTSTSEELLQRMPRLLMAVSSARYERYKHPHPEVLYRLRQHRIPTLKTEDWGNIWFEK
ncbi:hydrolase [Bdellovibrio sp. SKB1291214]|uniref:ComEC/Rec2 family competence protein n=1 Tax=Bdellovibrio sp. SKB1291214 TaxID=1732569 RepID=UPI00223F3EE8|nr:hydrolase [Bdellovibrio sp. SKB1291214]UYL07618.1 hydrolase [Bdellovibrio sp. SKB1291214]